MFYLTTHLMRKKLINIVLIAFFITLAVNDILLFKIICFCLLTFFSN